MGGGASTKKKAKAPDGPKASSPASREEGKDGRQFFHVRVVDGGKSPLTAHQTVRLAVCEDFLELVDMQSKTVITSFRYRDIPYWSITPETFSFKYNYERVPRPGGTTSVVRACDIKLRTKQAKEISVTLRTHVYKKAHEIARRKRAMGPEGYKELLERVMVSGTFAIKAYVDHAKSVAEAASAEVARATAPEKGGKDTKESPMSSAKLVDTKRAKELVLALPDPFEMVDGACLLYPVLIDQRNFEAVLSAFETEEDRDNVCHRLQIPYAMSRERSEAVAIVDIG